MFQPFRLSNRFDELAVGAPLFSNTVGNRIGHDEGRVFIFINNGKGTVRHIFIFTYLQTFNIFFNIFFTKYLIVITFIDTSYS